MKLKSIIIVILIIAALGFLFQQKFVQEPILKFLNNSIPWSIPTFAYIKDNISSGTLIGLILFLVFVNIPLLPSPPAEAYIIFSFLKGTNIFGIILFTVAIYMFFALIYYFIGRFFGQRLLERMLKRPVGYSQLLDRLTGPLIFFVYMLPIPLPLPGGTIFVLLSGFYKTDIRKVMAAVGMGTLFRFVIIITLYQYLPFASWLKFG